MSDGVLVRLAPEALLVSKNAGFTHDRMNFGRNVRGKRFRRYKVVVYNPGPLRSTTAP